MTANTNPLTYNGYVTQLATMAVVDTAISSGVIVGVDTAFNNIIPQMLNYAELRIQRDLDLLPLMTDKNYTLTSGNNQLQIPVDDFVTIQTLFLNNAPLLATSKEFIQNVFGSNSVTGMPKYFAMLGGDFATGGNTYNNILLAPYPDSNYSISVLGTIRAPSLYKYANLNDADTKTTFISTYLPDLLVQASMIYITEFQRNFGAVSNDPAMGQTYESQYQNLLKGAIVEEARKKFQASGWSSSSLPLVASPAR